MFKEDEAHLRVYSKVDNVLSVLIKTARAKAGTPVYRELIETANAIMSRAVSDVSLRAVREKIKKTSVLKSEPE